MNTYTRRDVLRLGAALAAGLGLGRGHSKLLAEGLDKILAGRQKVLWLQGMSCSGCSVSFLNADQPGPLEILTEVISLVYHQTISAAQGDVANQLIADVTKSGDYLVVVEGAVPLDMPEACVIGGKPFGSLLLPVLNGAKAIIAAGTCAAFGGIPAAQGNPTAAAGLKEFMGRAGLPVENRLINCPGCPVHPQKLLGTLAYVIAKGYPQGRPGLAHPRHVLQALGARRVPPLSLLGKAGIRREVRRRGVPLPTRLPGTAEPYGLPPRAVEQRRQLVHPRGAPCMACTSRDFARKKDFPFYRKGEACHAVAYVEADRKGKS